MPSCRAEQGRNRCGEVDYTILELKGFESCLSHKRVNGLFLTNTKDKRRNPPVHLFTPLHKDDTLGLEKQLLASDRPVIFGT